MEQSSLSLLVEKALEARKNAYCPYSGYSVGAALLTSSGRIFTGCNIENASFGATNCAERTAAFKAVSEGEREFVAIAICGGLKDQNPTDYAYPCGICRQVLNEFALSDFQVIVVKSANNYQMYRFDELLPHSFGGENIN